MRHNCACCHDLKWINDTKTGLPISCPACTDKPMSLPTNRAELLELFQDFFTFHNEANKDYSGIVDLFDKWYSERFPLTDQEIRSWAESITRKGDIKSIESALIEGATAMRDKKIRSKEKKIYNVAIISKNEHDFIDWRNSSNICVNYVNGAYIWKNRKYFQISRPEHLCSKMFDEFEITSWAHQNPQFDDIMNELKCHMK